MSGLGAVIEQADHDGEHGARNREVDRHDRDQDPPAVDASHDADERDDQERGRRKYGQQRDAPIAERRRLIAWGGRRGR